MTGQDLLDDIRARLDEPSEDQWTDKELIRWLNEGLRDIARRLEVLQSSTTVAVTGGTQEYTLPVDATRIYRVEWLPDGDSGRYPLEYKDFNSMDSVWYSGQTIAQGYPYWYTMWGYTPNCKITLYPTPTGDGDIKVFYYGLPTEFALDGSDLSNTVDIPTGWEDLIALYVEVVAKRKDADPTWQEAKSLYMEQIAEMEEHTRRWTDQADAIQHGTTWLPGWLYGGGSDSWGW